MVNKAKAKGTAGETRVVRFLHEHGFAASRVVMKGSKDQGDIHVDGPLGQPAIILEVKSGQQTQNVSRKQREDWLKETEVEGRNAGTPYAYLVVAKHRSPVHDYHVWSSDGSRFWYLDQFIKYLRGAID